MDNEKTRKHAVQDGNLEQRVAEIEKRLNKLERKSTVNSFNYGKLDLQRLVKLLPEIIKRYSR